MKKISDRQRIINFCLDLIREKLKRERGNQCEICGRTPNNLGLFHIIRRSRSPRLILNTFNLLLTCWLPCHKIWHTFGPNDPHTERIENRIKELRGNDYMDLLYQAEAIAPKQSLSYLKLTLAVLKQEQERLQ